MLVLVLLLLLLLLLVARGNLQKTLHTHTGRMPVDTYTHTHTNFRAHTHTYTPPAEHLHYAQTQVASSRTQRSPLKGATREELTHVRSRTRSRVLENVDNEKPLLFRSVSLFLSLSSLVLLFFSPAHSLAGLARSLARTFSFARSRNTARATVARVGTLSLLPILRILFLQAVRFPFSRAIKPQLPRLSS